MLYAITDSHLTPGDALFDACEAALKGGCGWLQYRDKSNDYDKRLAEASQLQTLCEFYDAQLIINDDVALAVEVGARGVHLGQEDGCLAEARYALGNEAIVGITCHDQLDLAEQGISDGASYVAFGRFFPSKTKPNAKPASLNLLSHVRSLGVPTIAIGGISLDNASTLITAGASAIAVCHSLFTADDIEQRAREFCQLFEA